MRDETQGHTKIKCPASLRKSNDRSESDEQTQSPKFGQPSVRAGFFPEFPKTDDVAQGFHYENQSDTFPMFVDDFWIQKISSETNG